MSEAYRRVTLDLDISFEEAQLIRDEYIRKYDMRKIELIHQSRKQSVKEHAGEIKFQSVDTTIVEGLMNVKSDHFRNDRLVEIYRGLEE